MNDSPADSTSTGSIIQEIDLRDILALLQDQWRSMVLIIGATVFAALIVALTTTPVYRTNALIQIEEKTGGLGGLGSLAVLSGEAPTQAEIEIVRSRSVLSAAIEDESLQISARPHYFPFIGEAIARLKKPAEGVAEPLMGLDQFAWGGERIKVDRLEVPRFLAGSVLMLVTGDDGAYTIEFENQILLNGKVGQPSEENGISIFVSELLSRPGVQFELVAHNWLNSLRSLSNSLSVAELGKQTGILRLSLDGPDPQKIASTLNTLAATYLRQNVERTSEDAAQTLLFLDEQLPILKTQLDGAESALNQYRIKQGSVDLTLETQGLLKQVGDIEKQLSELELKQAELAQRFTSEHPMMLAIGQQRSELNRAYVGLEQKIRELPEAERDSLRLMRDVRVANELYMLLLNRAQELKVVRAGAIGNVRIVDPAYVPLLPYKPRKTFIVSLGFLLGMILGAVFIFVREAFNPAIRSPEDLEKAVGLPVYAIIPHSARERELNSKLDQAESGQLLLSAHEEDVAIESLRSLRTSLEFLLLDMERKVIVVGGPAPGAGKSFVSANLAALFARAGNKVLLIDADLRKGHLHRLFGGKRDPGMTELISGQIPKEAAIRQGVSEGLDFLSTGKMPPNPSELITSPRFEKMLDDLLKDYEIVLMDVPPVLGAAESMTLARFATVSLLVVRSEQQTPKEVALAINKLKQAGSNPNGFVLNDLKVDNRRHSYGGYHYYHYGRK